MKKLICIILMAAFVVGVIDASAATKSGLNSFNFGNSQAGAKGSYSVNVENRTSYARVNTTANGNVMFLGKTVKGVEFSATAENTAGRKTATYQLSLAGYTVDSGTKTVSYTWSKAVNRTLVDASLLVFVGPVPVTVRGSVGGGASIGYGFTLSTSSVRLDGTASGWANGSASAGVGIPLLNLSLRSDLQLAKTTLNPYATVAFSPLTMSGGANLVFDPVKIDFYASLQTMGKSWLRYDLASYSQPSKTYALLRL
jgi:hypothetical protein